MTRRKSVCLKWTLVLFVVVFCRSVYSRPQESSVTTVKSDLSEKTTQDPLRYRNRYNSFSILEFVPIVISFFKSTAGNVFNNSFILRNNTITKQNVTVDTIKINRSKNPRSNRTGRLIYSITQENKKKNKPKPVKLKTNTIATHEEKKPLIRKVITRWRDKTKYDDLNSFENTSSLEDNKANLSTDITSTEHSDVTHSKRYTKTPNKAYYNMYNKPKPQYSEETQVHSTNIQVIDTYRPTRPPYFFTNIPTPTPVITNVGYPQPWTPNIRRTTTQRSTYATKPIKYEYHNHVNNNYDVHEVTTEQPNSYTEKIVIRPDEYSPSAEDCPTIYLTLNNTFQGQAKEACPDLNIAVNTNVINKNVVVESEEETDALFPGGFGLGFEDDNDSNGSKDEDYFESNENQEDASVEGTELANYHSANSVIHAESDEPGNYGAGTSQNSAISLPGRPGHSEDDIFSFSSLVEFFRPAFDALGWLASINPLSIGLFPLFLAPLGILFAGSGFAALFGPWFLPYAREAPKIIHVYKPDWYWDNNLKTWHWHSFPNNRRVVPELGRASEESKDDKKDNIVKLLPKLKTLLTDLTQKLKERQNLVTYGRKSKRKKR